MLIWCVMVSQKKVPAFSSESARIFAQVERKVFRRESNRSLLSGPVENLGPERGQLDKLYAAFVAARVAHNGVQEATNYLLAEVERYARRVTLGQGGELAQQLHQSATKQYPATEVSQQVMSKVWLNLDQFKGESKFSVWVYRIAKNTVLDAIRQIQRRGEVELLEWRNYGGGEYAGSRGASSESADNNFDIGSGSKLPLVQFCAPDDRKVKLSLMIANLSVKDQRIIYLVQEGYKPSEIGEKFGQNAKWASNQLNRIKKLLKQAKAKVRSPSVIMESRLMVSRSPTIEAGHIIRAYVDGDLNAQRRIEEYGRLEAEKWAMLFAPFRDPEALSAPGPSKKMKSKRLSNEGANTPFPLLRRQINHPPFEPVHSNGQALLF